MKTLRLKAAIMVFASAFVLGTATAVGAADPAQEKFDPAAFARGAKAWADNCGRCHNVRDPKDFRDDQWKMIMTHMRLTAGLTGRETRDILKFLQGSN